MTAPFVQHPDHWLTPDERFAEWQARKAQQAGPKPITLFDVMREDDPTRYQRARLP
jgi:hypothetical protein